MKYLLRDESGFIGGIIGAIFGSKASKAASRSQQAAADAAAAAQLEMYYKTREDLAPWREAGGWALGELRGRLEAGPGVYEESPYYNFLLEQGTRGLERGAAARGGQLSGAEQEALTRYGQNLASTDYSNWLARYYQGLTPYQSLAGVGQTAAAQTGQAGMQAGAGQASALLAGGQAQAAGQLGAWAPYGNLINWGGNQLMNYYMMNKMGLFS